MHYEFLTEDISGKTALEIIVPKILNSDLHTFEIHSYKGIGRIPKNLGGKPDASKRILLDQLPRILRGYGKTFASYGKNYQVAVIVVCDLDNKCLKTFKSELQQLLDSCNPKPTTEFCIAVEEGEAWFLGDINAIKSAYPHAKDTILAAYKNDSICGTWEILAEAVSPHGVAGLSSRGWHAIGAEKSEWARNISPLMNIETNLSPSFIYFKDTVKKYL
jgi:hypothetical protein